ncbi:MAG: hypothetical protein ACW98Y_00220 [Candidatus Thorarchaeota archaeon]
MRSTLVFSLVLIISAGLITGTNYILTLPSDTPVDYSDPQVILSEYVNYLGGGIVHNTGSIDLEVDVPFSQIQFILIVLNGSISPLSLISSTSGVVHEFGNESFDTGNYSSEWLEIFPGNYTIQYAFDLQLKCYLELLARYPL